MADAPVGPPLPRGAPACSPWRRIRTIAEAVSLALVFLLIGVWAGIRLDSLLLGLVSAALTFLLGVAIGSAIGVAERGGRTVFSRFAPR